MIYYFTGTGNSLWAAKELARELGEPIESIIKHKKQAQVCCSDKLIGFVFPTYMGDLPWIAKEFLIKFQALEDCYIFAVMTSNGGQSGKAFQSLDQGLSCCGKKLSAGFDLQMPGNCLVSTDAENQERLQRAPLRLNQILQAIREKQVNYISDNSRPGEDYVTGSYFYGEHSLKRLTLMKNFSVTEKCNSCGVCAAVCPMDNIQLKQGKAVHGHACAACYACLHWCPQNATLLNVPTLKHRAQYHHPEITRKDIMEAQKC